MEKETIIKIGTTISALGLFYYVLKKTKNCKILQKKVNDKEFRVGSEYVNKKGFRLTPLHKQLISETNSQFPTRAVMLGGKDTAFLMANLIKIQKSQISENPDKSEKTLKGFEIGVFTGFSTLVMAEALPLNSKIIALDIEKSYTDLAQKFWKKAGVSEKIDLHLTPAVDFLKKLAEDETKVGTFDFAFVDADKISYPKYYEYLLILLKKGGWICFDNAFCGGNLIGVNSVGWDRESIKCMDKLNGFLNEDERVSNVLLNIADGVHMVVKN